MTRNPGGDDGLDVDASRIEYSQADVEELLREYEGFRHAAKVKIAQLADAGLAELKAVMVGPTDRLVLVFRADITMAEAARIRALLAEIHLDDRVLIVAGVQGLAVLRGEAPS